MSPFTNCIVGFEFSVLINFFHHRLNFHLGFHFSVFLFPLLIPYYPFGAQILFSVLSHILFLSFLLLFDLLS